MAIINCPECSKEISDSAKACPHCGFPVSNIKQRPIIDKNLDVKPKEDLFEKNKKWIIIGIVLFLPLIVFLMIIGGNKSNETTTFNSTQKQEFVNVDQEQFINLINDFKQKFKAATTDIKRTNARFDRKNALESLIPNQYYCMKVWTGEVTRISTDTYGDAVVDIKIAGNIHLQTASEKIERGTEVYKDATKINVGDYIEFSGTFLLGDETDWIKEYSLTERGSMDEPEFQVILVKIWKKSSEQTSKTNTSKKPKNNTTETKRTETKKVEKKQNEYVENILANGSWVCTDVLEGTAPFMRGATFNFQYGRLIVSGGGTSVENNYVIKDILKNYPSSAMFSAIFEMNNKEDMITLIDARLMVISWGGEKAKLQLQRK